MILNRMKYVFHDFLSETILLKGFPSGNNLNKNLSTPNMDEFEIPNMKYSIDK